MQTRKGKEITDVRKSNGGAKSKNFRKSEKVKFIPIIRTRSQKQKDEKHAATKFTMVTRSQSAKTRVKEKNCMFCLTCRTK